jgi:hypothetical protein
VSGQANNDQFYEFPTPFMREYFQKTKEDVWLSGFFIDFDFELKFHFVLSNGWTTYKPDQVQQKKDKKTVAIKVDHGQFKLFQMKKELKCPKTVKLYLSKKLGFLKGIVYLDKNSCTIFEVGKTKKTRNKVIEIKDDE